MVQVQSPTEYQAQPQAKRQPGQGTRRPVEQHTADDEPGPDEAPPVVGDVLEVRVRQREVAHKTDHADGKDQLPGHQETTKRCGCVHGGCAEGRSALPKRSHDPVVMGW